jgi:phosphoribosylglycinamide formyltransferase-1
MPDVLEWGWTMVSDIAVLISGRGSNLLALMAAIERGELDARIALVASNRAEAPGLAHARAAGIETVVVPHGAYPGREAYDQALVTVLREARVELVCLAGFMRLLSQTFCEAFRSRVLNVHPSLLPAFPGVDAQRQALEHGVKVSGATVHFVTPELDAGPVILQSAVPVLDADTVETLSERILAVEHVIYPQAVQRVLSGRWRLSGRRVLLYTTDASTGPRPAVR